MSRPNDANTNRGERSSVAADDDLPQRRKRFSRTKHQWKRQCDAAMGDAEALLDTQKKKGRVLRVRVLQLAKSLLKLGIAAEEMYDISPTLGFSRLHDVQMSLWETCEALEEYSTWLLRLAKRRGVQDNDFPLYTNWCKRPAEISTAESKLDELASVVRR